MAYTGTGQSNVLQQMVSPLDVSGSAVDEIVNQKVMEMMQ